MNNGKEPLRVLVVAHNCVGASNRKRVEALARMPGLEGALLTPRWWFEEGRRIDVRDPRGNGFTWRTGRTLATNNGTRHVYLSGLRSLLAGFRPDVIDLHEEPFSFVALQALLARDLLAPRAAFVFCSYVNVYRTWRLPYRLIERYVLRRADGAYAPNADVPPILAAKGLRVPARTIPSGVDVDRFASAQPSADLQRALADASRQAMTDVTESTELPPVLAGGLGATPPEEKNLPLSGEGAGGWGKRPYLGFVGRLEPVKGLDYLLRAFAMLVDVPGTLLIAGDGPERATLQAQATELGIAGRVRFLGAVPFAEVPAFVKMLDVCVLPSVTILPAHKEQFGRTLTEAMAAGVAVVGSTSGAIPEVVGDAGVIVPERDAGALADALRRLMGGADVRADLVERGRRRVAERFAFPVVAAQAVELYRDAIERRQGFRSPPPAPSPGSQPGCHVVPRTVATKWPRSVDRSKRV